jgi:hypothetical protein
MAAAEAPAPAEAPAAAPTPSPKAKPTAKPPAAPTVAPPPSAEVPRTPQSEGGGIPEHQVVIPGAEPHYQEGGARGGEKLGTNASAKDINIATYLTERGIHDLRKLTDEDLNGHINDLNTLMKTKYKPMGSDYGGKKLGRSVERGRQDLQAAMDKMRSERIQRAKEALANELANPSSGVLPVGVPPQ